MLPSAALELNPAERRLQRDGEAVSLPPKVLRLLLYLIERPGELLTRDSLLAGVWPDVTVSGDALRYTLRQVRVALGDTSSRPRFIETVPRRGWRFIGEAAEPRPGTWAIHPQQAESLEGTRSAGPTLVGRQAESRALAEALDRAQQGQPQMVALSGEAGIGKTAVVEAFLALLGEESNLLIVRGQCIEHHGASEPYLPLFDALDDLCRSQGRETVAALLRQTAPLWLAQIPALTDPDELRALQVQNQGAGAGRMLREITHAFEVLAKDRTVVLWIDDLHWCDGPSLDWLAHLLRRSSGAPILVVGCHRPVEAHGSALTTFLRDLCLRDLCDERALDVLTATEIDTYLDQRLDPALPAEDRAALCDLLAQRTEGNPLFMASVMNDLLDRGVLSSSDQGWELKGSLEGLETPTTIQRLLQQEIARIDPRHREILEMASIAGMEFSAAALSEDPASLEAVEECCEDLSGSGRLLVSRGIEQWPDGTVASRFAFSHALHREAFEAGLSPGRRARLHQEVGQRKEFSFQGREEQIAVELAHHFDQAGDATRAVTYYAKAGEEAAKRGANAEALSLLERGIDLLPSMPESPNRTLQELVLRLTSNVPLAALEGYASSQIAENLERIEALGVLTEENPAFSSVLFGLWSLNLVRGDMPHTAEIGQRLIEMADRTDDPELFLQAHRAYGHAQFYRGELEDSAHHIGEGLSRYPVAEHQQLDYSTGDDPVVLSFAYRSWTRWFQGHADSALDDVEQAIAWGEKLKHPPSLALAFAYRAVLQLLRRDRPAILTAVEELDALAQDHEMSLWIALAQLIRGLTKEGDIQLVLEEADRGIEAWTAVGSGLGLPWFLTLRAELATRMPPRPDETEPFEEIEAAIRQTGQVIFRGELRRVEGMWLARKADPEGAATAFRDAIGMANADGAASMALRAALSWADADAAARGRPSAECLTEIRGALDGLSDGANEPDTLAARRWLGA